MTNTKQQGSVQRLVVPISPFASHGLQSSPIETCDELDHVLGTPTLLLGLLRTDHRVPQREDYGLIAISGARSHWAINLLGLRARRPHRLKLFASPIATATRVAN